MQTPHISAVAAHMFAVLSRVGSHNDHHGIFGRARELVRWQLRVIRRRQRIAATRVRD